MKIAVITNETKDVGRAAAAAVTELLRGRAEIYMSDECRSDGDGCVTYVPYEELWKNAEAAVVIGGDGTLLRVAPDCARNGIPALGINLGKVGFLTEVEPDDMAAAIDKLLSGDYATEQRMLLKITVNGESAGYHALNDLVISKAADKRLISIDLYTDGEPVNHYVGDGLIIATPTGSTGYSISAGGPVADPSLSLYIATPICAHMLSVRSAVLSAQHSLTLRLGGDYEDNTAVILADGEKKRIITAADEVTVTRSNYRFELIRIGRRSFYHTFINKL